MIARKDKSALIAGEAIACRIKILRGQRVMLDADLAALYGLPTKHFNQAIRRNLARFPADFMFQLNNQDIAALRSQTVTLETGRGRYSKYPPYAFTEHGAIMAATILNTPRATEVSVYVVRAFVELHDALRNHKDLAKRLDELEARIEKKFDTHDQAITGILSAIRHLMAPVENPKKRRIGFVQEE